MHKSEDFQILISSRSWVATPWDYSSLRGLRFNDDSTGEFIFGYGQTIYAIIKCRFELSKEILRLNYLESPASGRFQGYSPDESNQLKEINYKLSPEIVTGVESIVAREFKFNWTLTLEQSPFPEDLNFPYDIPLIYYGHEEEASKQKSADN